MNARRSKRIQELFQRGAALPGAQRAEWLDSVCGSDDELRRELESLLEHHREETLFSDLPASSEVRIDRTPPQGLPRRRWFTPPWRVVAFGVLATGLLLTTYLFALRDMERSVHERVGRGLEAMLHGYEQAVVRWIQFRERQVEAWAADERLAELSAELVERADKLMAEGGDDWKRKLRELPLQAEIHSLLGPVLAEHEGSMYTVLNRSGFVLSTVPRFGQQFGLTPDEPTAAYISGIFQGQVRFVPPMFFDTWFTDPMPDELLDQASTWCNAPIQHEGRIVAALGLGLPASEFDELLQPEEFFATADLYAFDVAGMLVSEPTQSTRVIPQEEAGDLPSSERVRLVRDPGGDTTAGYEPVLAAAARPHTQLANEAITSRHDPSTKGRGSLTAPYRDYRGVEVVGAWRWLEEYGIGLAVELRATEALRPLGLLRRSFGYLFAGLGLALLIAVWMALRTARAARAAGGGSRLGPYTLIRPIGEGGVGRVYLASHALLRRNSAVKLLREDQLSDEVRTRFEREVQLASQLEHPNTIQIHDYGHTEDGTFYYAMEYLKGENLAQHIRREGRMEPTRVVRVLRQVCGSLREAHDRGLVHRDIKPQNVMLCTRAGISDVVKVLDFGLAKDLEAGEEQDLTRMARITGTPLYMAPERIRDPSHTDRRVDIYAVGALAHFLLTGRRMFEADSDITMIESVLRVTPAPLATGGVGDPSPELARLVASCLEKEPDARPSTIAELLLRLEACPEATAPQASPESSPRVVRLVDRPA